MSYELCGPLCALPNRRPVHTHTHTQIDQLVAGFIEPLESLLKGEFQELKVDGNFGIPRWFVLTTSLLVMSLTHSFSLYPIYTLMNSLTPTCALMNLCTSDRNHAKSSRSRASWQMRRSTAGIRSAPKILRSLNALTMLQPPARTSTYRAWSMQQY